MPDLRSRNVMTGRFHTHYTECGSNGPAVVLCHGGGPGSSGEAGFAQLMPSLAAKFQVYALDSVGGFGETDAGGWAGPYFDDDAGKLAFEHALSCDVFLLDAFDDEDVCVGPVWTLEEAAAEFGA